MLFSKLMGLFLLFVTLISACPIAERATESDGLEPRSRLPNGKRAPHKPGCIKVSDCKCPAPKNDNKIHSTSCINHVCKCDDAGIALFGNTAMKAIEAIGNAPITKAIGNLMAGLSDVKEVIAKILGTFLGPEAKAALKAALMAFPDTGPSHIDRATKNILQKAF